MCVYVCSWSVDVILKDNEMEEEKEGNEHIPFGYLLQKQESVEISNLEQACTQIESSSTKETRTFEETENPF